MIQRVNINTFDHHASDDEMQLIVHLFRRAVLDGKCPVEASVWVSQQMGFLVAFEKWSKEEFEEAMLAFPEPLSPLLTIVVPEKSSVH